MKPFSLPSFQFLALSTLLAISPTLLAAKPQIEAQVIDPEIGIGYGLEITDMNGDGKPDIILVDKDNVAWYENPSWTKHVIAGHLTEKDHVCLAARDITGDGRAEVAIGAQWFPKDTQDSGAVFLLETNGNRADAWKHTALHHEPTVHRMHWVKGTGDNYFLTVLPLHGRGNNIGTGEGAGIKILGYKDGGTFLINDQFHKAHNYDIVARGKKQPEALLVASMEGVHLLTPAKGKWKSSQLSSEQAGEVRHGKLPNGKPFVTSIEPMHGNAVVVNTFDKIGHNAKHLSRSVLVDNYIQGHALATADLLGNGSDQIIAGRRGARPNDPVGIQLFASNKDGSRWELVLDIDKGTMACEDLKVGDLNGDGKPEVVACGRRTKNVVIYWNK